MEGGEGGEEGGTASRSRSAQRGRSPPEDTEDSRRAAVQHEMKRQHETKRIYNIQQLRQRLRSLSYDNGGQNPAKLFQQFDADSSGALDYREFTAAVRRGGKITRQWMSDVELKQLFETVDKNGDKEITLDELTEFVWGADAVPATLRSPAPSTSPRGTSHGRTRNAVRNSGEEQGQEAQEVLYMEFEKTLATPDTETGDRAAAQLGKVSSSPRRRRRQAELTGWVEEGQSEDEVVAAFERGLDDAGSRRRRSAGLDALVSPTRRLKSPDRFNAPSVQPYYDTSLPFYGQVPVAKKASTKTLKRLASPLDHKVTPPQTEEAPASTKPMWKVNTTPRVVVDKMTALRLDSEDPDERDGMSLLERQVMLARKAKEPAKTDAKSAGEADFAERLYAEAQQKKLNLERKQASAKEAQLQEEKELCAQFKAQPLPGKSGEAGATTQPVEVRFQAWLQSKKEQEEAGKRKIEEEFAEAHSFAPKLNPTKKSAAGAETTGTIYTRQKDWLTARAQKLADKQEEKAQQEVEGLTFRPEISARAKRADMSELRTASPVHDRLYRHAAETQQSHQGRRDELHQTARILAARGTQLKSLADQRDASMRLYSPERSRQGAGRLRRTSSRESLSGSIRKRELSAEQLAANVERLASPGRLSRFHSIESISPRRKRGSSLHGDTTESPGRIHGSPRRSDGSKRGLSGSPSRPGMRVPSPGGTILSPIRGGSPFRSPASSHIPVAAGRVKETVVQRRKREKQEREEAEARRQAAAVAAPPAAAADGGGGGRAGVEAAVAASVYEHSRPTASGEDWEHKAAAWERTAANLDSALHDLVDEAASTAEKSARAVQPIEAQRQTENLSVVERRKLDKQAGAKRRASAERGELKDHTQAQTTVVEQAETTATLDARDTDSVDLGGGNWIDRRGTKISSDGQHASEPEPVSELESAEPVPAPVSQPEQPVPAPAEPETAGQQESEPKQEDSQEREGRQVQMSEQEAFQRAKACVQNSDWAGFAEVTAQVASFRGHALQQIATHASATSSTELSPVEEYLNALSQRTGLSTEESAALEQARELRQLQQLALGGVLLEEQRETAVHSSQAKLTVIAADGRSPTEPGPAPSVAETERVAATSVVAETSDIIAVDGGGGGDTADWTQISKEDSDASSDDSMEPI